MTFNRDASWKDDLERAGEPEVIPFWRPRLSVLGWVTLLSACVAGGAFWPVAFSIYQSKKGMYENGGAFDGWSFLPFGMNYDMSNAYDWNGSVRYFVKLNGTELLPLIISSAVFAVCILLRIALVSFRRSQRITD